MCSLPFNGSDSRKGMRGGRLFVCIWTPVLSLLSSHGKEAHLENGILQLSEHIKNNLQWRSGLKKQSEGRLQLYKPPTPRRVQALILSRPVLVLLLRRPTLVLLPRRPTVIWDSVVLMNLFSIVDQIWTVCAFLCNLQEPIVSSSEQSTREQNSK